MLPLNFYTGRVCSARSSSGELEGDVFDILLSFSDFGRFKEMMIDYKTVRASHYVTTLQN